MARCLDRRGLVFSRDSIHGTLDWMWDITFPNRAIERETTALDNLVGVRDAGYLHTVSRCRSGGAGCRTMLCWISYRLMGGGSSGTRISTYLGRGRGEGEGRGICIVRVDGDASGMRR